MKTFITQQMGGSEELRSKLVQTEGDFAVAYKAIADGAEALRKTGEQREVTQAEARRLRMEENDAEAKCRDVEQENDHLKKELEELWTGFVSQKKKLEDEYQKQVDDMFLFGYQYCMKKNDIT